jgi:hypothetical protein
MWRASDQKRKSVADHERDFSERDQRRDRVTKRVVILAAGILPTKNQALLF